MKTEKQVKPTKAVRSVVEVMDEALMQEGWTREQLDAQRRTGDIIAELMAEGYSGDTLDTELQCRISQARLAEAGAKRTRPRSAKPQIALNETS